MPIEDIHYLYKNSVKENIVLLIDSRKRNKHAWRTASEFVIDFPESFKNVYGVEILNASVPRTTFTIDSHNRLLSLFMYTESIDQFNDRKMSHKFENRELVPNDFNSADKLLASLSALMIEIDDSFAIEADSSALEADVDIATKGFIRLKSTRTPFIVNTLKTTMNVVLGFTLLPDIIDDDKYTTKTKLLGQELKVFSDINMSDNTHVRDHLVINIKRDELTFDDDEKLYYKISFDKKKINSGLYVSNIKLNGSVYDVTKLNSTFIKDELIIKDLDENIDEHKVEIDFYYLFDNSKEIMSIPFDNFFASRIESYLIQIASDSRIEDNMVKFYTEVSTSVFLYKFQIRVYKIDDLDVDSIIYLKFVSNHESIEQDIYFQCKYVFANNKYYIVYDISNENMNVFNYIKIFSVLYEVYWIKRKDTLIRLNLRSVLVEDDDANTFTEYTYQTDFRIRPPGILNLITENYVLLRCPEIENHIRGSYDANDASPGLALFAIDVKSGYAPNNTEMTSVIYKEFHPIGRLSRLHFRFERKSDGELYDFKGVDLHFILSVKMFAPAKINEGAELKYTLNPNYKPDYQGFLTTEFDFIESDEEEEEKKFKKKYFDTENSLNALSIQKRRLINSNEKKKKYDISEYSKRKSDSDSDESDEQKENYKKYDDVESEDTYDNSESSNDDSKNDSSDDSSDSDSSDSD